MSHFHLITTSARSTLYRPKLSASLVASCAQLCLHKHSSLKMPHRGIFFTVGFKSLRAGQKKTPRRVSFFGPARRDLNPHSPESESVALSNCATGRCMRQGILSCRFSIFNSHNLLSEINCKTSCAQSLAYIMRLLYNNFLL